MEKLDNYEFYVNFGANNVGFHYTEEDILNAFRNNDASHIFYHDERRGGCFEKDYYEPTIPALAILSNGYIDIELDFDATYENGNIIPYISYVVCIKFGEDKDDWEVDDWYENVTNDEEHIVDFTKENWKELLEEEMFEKLDKYCKVKGYDYTKPIKY